jgi:hypothetical protein
VPTRSFDNSNPGTFPAPPLSRSLQMGSYAAPMLRRRVIQERGVYREMPAEAVADIRVLGKGVGWALAIEGAAALCVCLVWHLCSLLR